MGPGLALIDAILDGEPESVRLLHEVVGNHALLTFVGEVTRRAVGLRDDFDEDTVLEFMEVHSGRWGTYDEFVIRLRDQYRAVSPAMRSAWATAHRLLRQWLRCALAENNATTPTPDHPKPDPLRGPQRLHRDRRAKPYQLVRVQRLNRGEAPDLVPFELRQHQ